MFYLPFVIIILGVMVGSSSLITHVLCCPEPTSPVTDTRKWMSPRPPYIVLPFALPEVIDNSNTCV